MSFFYNQEEGRPRAFWRLLVQAVIYIVILIGTNICVGAVFGVIYFATNPSVDPTTIATAAQQNPVVRMVTTLGSLAAVLISVFFAARRLDHRPFRDYGFHFNTNWWIDFLFGLALGAICMAVIFGIELAAGWITITGYALPDPANFAIGAILFAITFIVVGISEELLSRGYQLRNLAEGLNGPLRSPRAALLAAYVLSSAVFGLLHIFNPNFSIVAMINLAVAGIFLGLGYVLTGELAIPIGLHITWNFFEGVVFGFPVSGLAPSSTLIGVQQVGPEVMTGGAFGPEAGIMGLVGIAVGAVLTVLWVRWRRGRVGLEERLAVYARPGVVEAAPVETQPGARPPIEP